MPIAVYKRNSTISFHYTGVKVFGVDVQVGPFVFCLPYPADDDVGL